jgi:hypothetical protein
MGYEGPGFPPAREWRLFTKPSKIIMEKKPDVKRKELEFASCGYWV